MHLSVYIHVYTHICISLCAQHLCIYCVKINGLAKYMKIINLLFTKDVGRVKTEEYKRIEKTLTSLTKYCSQCLPQPGLVKFSTRIKLSPGGRKGKPAIHSPNFSPRARSRQWLELKVTPEAHILLWADLLLEADFLLGVDSLLGVYFFLESTP